MTAHQNIITTRNKWASLPFRKCFAVAILIASIVCLLCFCGASHKIRLPYPDQSYIEWSDSFASMRNSTYTVYYGQTNGMPGRFVLHADFDHSPVIILNIAKDRTLFCLYDCDTQLRLFKFDLNSTFRVDTNTARLSGLLVSSECYGEEASRDEWEKVFRTLQTMSNDSFKNE